MEQFGDYARYYDVFYRDKDYRGEATYVAETLRRHNPSAKNILELGCGTGLHATVLAESGFMVHGIDCSDFMLERAHSRLNCLSSELQERITFSKGDARNVRIERKFDAVLSLFHVMSYMSDEGALEEAFETAAKHLAQGGLFIFDCWYGPAVLTEQPHVRTRSYQDGSIQITREATPELLPNDNLVKVHYKVQIEDPPGTVAKSVMETHTLRYLFLPEMRYMLSKCGFAFLDAYEYMKSSHPRLDTWNVLVVARLK